MDVTGTGGGLVATAILVAGVGAGNYSSFCPSWMTVSSDFFNESSSRDGNVKRIRQGEAAATVLTLLEGGAASYLVGSWLPLIAATAIAVLFVGGYEYALANPAAHESDYAQSSAAVALRPRQFGAR